MNIVEFLAAGFVVLCCITVISLTMIVMYKESR